MRTLLDSVSVDLAELRRAPAPGGEGKFEMRNAEIGNWPSAAPSLADSGGAMEGYSLDLNQMTRAIPKKMPTM